MTYFDNPHLSFHVTDIEKKSFTYLFAFNIAENNSLYFGAYKDIMQSLNIFDRNGKQAYEDDIIEFSDTEGKIYKKIIKWDDKLLCYLIGNIPYKDLYNSGFIQPSKLIFDIIGNIHENPELMEGIA